MHFAIPDADDLFILVSKKLKEIFPTAQGYKVAALKRCPIKISTKVARLIRTL